MGSRGDKLEMMKNQEKEIDMGDFREQVKELSNRVKDIKRHLHSEEATKNAIIMPFLQILGYNVFDPQEVIPEYIADVGVKKGEKVDYAIFKDGKPIIIIECKPMGIDLNKNYYIDQLYRYFSVTDVQVAILTNGEDYMFYTDIEEKNKMDQRPFMVFNMLNIQESLIPELKRLSKEDFEIGNITASATDLKLIREIRQVLKKEFSSPTKDFMKYLISQIMPNKRRTSERVRIFSKLTKIAFIQLIKEGVNDRLASMLLDKPQDDLKDVFKVEKEAVLQESRTLPLENQKKSRAANRKIREFILRKKIYTVETWVDMLRTLCSLIITSHNNAAVQLVKLRSKRGLSYFSTNPGDMRQPEKILNSDDLYVETNLSASSIEQLCGEITSLFGYGQNEFVINESK